MSAFGSFSAYAQAPDRYSELDAIKNRTLLRLRDLDLVSRGMEGPEKTIATDINHKHELAGTLIGNGQDIIYFMMLADGREKNTQLVYGQIRLKQLIQMLDQEMRELTTLIENTANPLNMRSSAGLRGTLSDVAAILKSVE